VPEGEYRQNSSTEHPADVLFGQWLNAKAVSWESRSHFEDTVLSHVLEHEPELGLQVLDTMVSSGDESAQASVAVYLEFMSPDVPKAGYLALIGKLMQSPFVTVHGNLMETLRDQPVRADVSFAEMRDLIRPYIEVPSTAPSAGPPSAPDPEGPVS